MKLKMCRTQSVLALLALSIGLAHSWDVAVSYGDTINFYTNETLINTLRFESQSLTALAYDDVHNRILYVDKQANGDAICGHILSSVQNNCFTERSGRNIHGIAFDSVTDTVFFTDTIERTINSFSLKPGSQNNVTGNLLIKMDEGIPRDIIVDSCKRHIYWLITDKPNPTIERARLTGTEREVFQTMNSIYIDANYQFEPHSLAIDPQTQNVYWCEPTNTTEYRAYYLSVLNKEEKSWVFNTPLVQNPEFIHPSNTFAITNNLFYFVDFRYTGGNVYVWGKTFGIGGLPSRKILHNGSNTREPVGIVAYYQSTEETQDCETF